MTHTPGPWFCVEDDEGFLNLHTRDEGGEINSYIGTVDDEANARLIAAAPELLEALQIMVDHEVNYMTLNNLGDPEEQHGVSVSRAAIAKAKGESQ